MRSRSRRRASPSRRAHRRGSSTARSRCGSSSPPTPMQGLSVDVPALRIIDAPRFAWRGLMLDSARHFQSPEYIKQFIDWMALHKLNVLHWHLTDDQALAARDQEVSEAHVGGRVARAGGRRRRRPTSIRPPASRACTAASTRRTRCATSWRTPRRATSPWFRRSRCRATRPPPSSRIRELGVH